MLKNVIAAMQCRTPVTVGQVFTPETYGAVGNDVTDDTTAFQDMHTAIIAAQVVNPEIRIIIRLTAGKTYRYLWNRWLWGIRNFVVDGNGASIRCINNTGIAMLEAILHTNRGAFDISGYNETLWTNHMGYLIDTVLKNSTSVTLKTAAEASNFAVGKWVVIASYSQQSGGWPPNARYFDYVKVTNISGGVISVDRAIKYDHRDDWPSRGYTEEIDVARIIAAEREIPWAVTGVIRNITALFNPNAESYWGGIVQVEGFDSFELDNVTIPFWVCGQGRSIVLRNSVLPESEQDKMVTFVRIENCNPANFYIGSGVDKIEVVGSYLPGTNWFCGRELWVDNCIFDGAMTVWNALWVDSFSPVYKIEVRNSTFNGIGRGDWPVPSDATSVWVTIGQNFTSLDGTDIVISGNSIPVWANFENYFGLMCRIYEGAYLLLQDNTQTTKGYGQVVSIRTNGGTFTARIVVNWSVTPVTGDRINQFAVDYMLGVNNTMNNVVTNTSYTGIAKFEWNGVVHQIQAWS